MATPNIVPRADSEGGIGTSSKYWASAYIDTITTTSHIVMPDNALLKIGTGTDLTLQHNGSNSYILNATGDLYITNNADDKDIIFQSDDGSGSAATYMTIDGSAVKILMQKSTVFTGGGMDFGVDDTGADVIFYGATSGRNMKWDESEDHLLFTDNTKLKIGTGADLQLYHDSSDSYVRAYNNDLIIMQDAADKDIIFKADDGSGSPTAYLTLDGSVAKTAVSKPLLFADNISAEYGADTDMIMYHSGGAGYIEHYTGNFNIIQHTNDGDIIFQCDDGSGGVTTYITIDGSATQTKFDKNARFNDSVRAEFGSSGDFVITHDGSDSKIENATGDLKIRNFSDNKDIIFENDNGAGGSTTYFYLDGSSATHDGSATTGLYTNWPDYSRISMGTSHDLQIYHDSTNSNIINAVGNLAIQNNANDGDIKFFCDDGSGGVTTYLQLDGGITSILAYKDILMAVDGDGGGYKNDCYEYDGSAWSSGGSTSRYRRGSSCAGIETAGLVCQGYALTVAPPSPPAGNANTEEYDGSAWTAGGDQLSHMGGTAGTGTQTAAINAGGDPNIATTQYYDGTSWTEQADLNTARGALAVIGVQTSAIAASGSGPAIPGMTEACEEWDGSSWTTVTSYSSARYGSVSAGTTTAGVFGFGYIPPSPYFNTATEEWNKATTAKTVTVS